MESNYNLDPLPGEVFFRDADGYNIGILFFNRGQNQLFLRNGPQVSFSETAVEAVLEVMK